MKRSVKNLLKADDYSPFKDKGTIIYSLTIADVQQVAKDRLGRSLNDDEIRIVEDKLGDAIVWYEPIAIVINEYIDKQS